MIPLRVFCFPLSLARSSATSRLCGPLHTLWRDLSRCPLHALHYSIWTGTLAFPSLYTLPLPCRTPHHTQPKKLSGRSYTARKQDITIQMIASTHPLLILSSGGSYGLQEDYIRANAVYITPFDRISASGCIRTFSATLACELGLWYWVFHFTPWPLSQ